MHRCGWNYVFGLHPIVLFKGFDIGIFYTILNKIKFFNLI